MRERSVVAHLTQLRARLAEGVLAFPATPFDSDDALDRAALGAHVRHLAAFGPCALVPAGGAGELFSLTLAEHEAVVAEVVAAAGGIPVVAGIGNGVALAVQMAQAAERAGAAAVLLLPPYLTTAEQDGLFGFIQAVCRSVSIGVIAYRRNNGILTTETALRLADACETFMGVKDGTGDFDTLNDLALRAGDRLVVINGVPTAEMLARQCFAIGIRSYSSAVYSFAPAVATRFYEAVRDGETAITDHLMGSLYLPLVALRNRRRGNAVSLVKGGLMAVGRSAGSVRPPLLDLRTDEVAAISGWITEAETFLARHPSTARG